MIDRVAEEELTIHYIMNAVRETLSNYQEHAKKGHRNYVIPMT